MFTDHREIRRCYDAAIESAHRCGDSERLKQHVQAAGWTAADHRKNYTACAQFRHGGSGERSQIFVIGHQSAVDIRDNG